MSGAISQIQMKYDPNQDRLMMRLNTSQSAEFRFWLTRRFVKRLWPALVKLMQKDENVSMQNDPMSRQAVMQFQHQESIAGADFKTEYREETVQDLPLGHAPLLVTQGTLNQNPETGHFNLGLHDEQKKGLNIGMEKKMLHTFCHLLADSVKKIEWDIKLQIGRGMPGPADATPAHFH
ncbi:MAG: hypothetical protein HQL54_04915 [Magnetococcales bacterium]|nr:hypothetical protein [Magnetococcales bacterium]